MRLGIATLCLGLSPAAIAATIDAVKPSSGTVILELSPDEQATFRAGDAITIQTRARGNAGIEGQIIDIQGSKASVEVQAKKGALKAGRAVAVASSAAIPMNISPSDVSDSTAGETPKAPRTPGYQPTIFHPSIQNPAQIYQVRSTRVDVETSFSSEEMSSSTAALSAVTSMHGPRLTAAALTSNRTGTLRGGFEISRAQMNGLFKIDGLRGDDEEFKLDTTQFMPMVGAEILPRVQVGLTYNVVQTKTSGDAYGGKAINLIYAQAIPGVVYVTPTYEAGMSFTPRLAESTNYTTVDGRGASVQVNKPAIVSFNGRGSLDVATTAFINLAYVQNRMLNDDEDQGHRNSADLMAGMTKNMGDETETFGALLFSSPSHNGDDQKAPTNIMTYGAIAGFDKRYTPTSRFGGSLSYERGRDDYKIDDDTVKVERDRLEMAVTGSIKL